MWFEKCYEEKEKEIEKEIVPENGKQAILFIKNYIKENYPSLDIIRGGGIKGGKRSGNWCRIKHSRWRNSSVFDGPFQFLKIKMVLKVYLQLNTPNLGENLINGRFFGFTVPYCGKKKCSIQKVKMYLSLMIYLKS